MNGKEGGLPPGLDLYGMVYGWGRKGPTLILRFDRNERGKGGKMRENESDRDHPPLAGHRTCSLPQKLGQLGWHIKVLILMRF